MKRAKTSVTLILLLAVLASTQAHAWGGDVHRLLNRSATWHLPGAFAPFASWVDDLESLSVAADQRKCCDSGESRRHYIDIDDYSEFFAGTLPRTWVDMVGEFGLSRVEDNGTVPWAIEDSYLRLVDRFLAGDWEGAVEVAADIGHYAGDLHNPMHLTVNFNGQFTNQSGIHSRHESEMTSRHLAALEPRSGQATFLADPLGSVFRWIDMQYPGVALILQADLNARASAGNTESEAYYDALWAEVGSETREWVESASINISSLWYSAWVDAGSPPLPGSLPVVSVT